MYRHFKFAICVLLIGMLISGPAPSFGRGGGGMRGGGGGGGISRGGGGGGGMARPAPRPSAPARSPSFSRPSAPVRPSGGAVARPGGAGGPSVGTRPAGPASRPSPGLTPGSRPGSVDFARPSTRPATPGLTPGTRPAVGGPGIGGPGVAGPGTGRPGVGTLPAGRPGQPGVGRPGSGAVALPGLGNRPGLDGGRLDGQRPNQLPAGERRNNLQDRLSSRDDIRNDRQDNRMDRREDWQDRYDNFYDRHDDWHHGCWNGNAGDWWHHMWEDHTALMAFGTTMWGINRIAYGFGYWGYDNPYYSEAYPIGDGAVVDYSQPIAVEEAPAMPPAEGAPVPGMSDFDAARQAFFNGDYAAALTSTNKALQALPNDPIIHEFRALVLFAQMKYNDSAAGLYSVLSVGPGWDWTTLSSLYPSIDVYTKQLRALEAYVKQNPQSQQARFVLAYHYMTAGNQAAAAEQLKLLYKATPQDKVIQELLLMTAGPEALGVKPAPETPAQPAATAPAIPVDALVGKWAASGPNNTKFALELTKEGNFTWTYFQGTKGQGVKGVFAIDGNNLAMEPESGGVMLAEITPPDASGFSFKMLGAPPGDAGLKFTKAP